MGVEVMIRRVRAPALLYPQFVKINGARVTSPASPVLDPKQ